MDLYKEASSIVKELSLDEKCKFCVGISFWNLFSIDRLNIPSITLCDGPHGLRKEREVDGKYQNGVAIKSICFPTATCVASTFDEELINKMGKAIGKECREEDVAVILGPGVNIKRLPICGRNFEYLSEDPYLSGKMASAFIKGIQSVGVGACIKHFAANNQERNRMITNSIIDERALREIYLKPFEIAIKESNPWCVMTSYNRLNGKYCSEKKELIDILKKEWNYDGCIVSDWGGVNDILEGLKSGLNIEMPGYGDEHYKIIKNAVINKQISEEIINESIIKVIELILKYKNNKKIPYIYDEKENIDLAQQIAEEGSVLLKNEDNILPGNNKQKIAIIGKLSKKNIYQGVGSSEVNPNYIDNAYEAFINNNCNIFYADGYSLEDEKIDDNLLNEALNVAKDKDIVYLFIGLPKYSEAESYDRKNLSLPESHNKLVYEIAKVNKNLVVILQAGSIVEMKWSHLPKAILLTHLGGCKGGNATVNLLLGKKNPCGKLSETYADNLEDYLSMRYYSLDRYDEEYRESIFVGYRYFDTNNIDIKYPFGFGLSYTSFEYSNMQIEHKDNNIIDISITVTNTGGLEGKEVVQLYVSQINSKIYRAKQELKRFKKINLLPKQSKKINFILDDECFSYYNIRTKKYEIEDGKYNINIGSASRDIRYSIVVEKRNEKSIPLSNINYGDLYKTKFELSREEFEKIYGGRLPTLNHQIYPFTINSTVHDIKEVYGENFLVKIINKIAHKYTKNDAFMAIAKEETFDNLPFRSIPMVTRNSINRKIILGFVDLLNKKYLKGVLKILKGIKFI